MTREENTPENQFNAHESDMNQIMTTTTNDMEADMIGKFFKKILMLKKQFIIQ